MGLWSSAECSSSAESLLDDASLFAGTSATEYDIFFNFSSIAFSVFTLLDERQEEHPACKN